MKGGCLLAQDSEGDSGRQETLQNLLLLSRPKETPGFPLTDHCGFFPGLQPSAAGWSDLFHRHAVTQIVLKDLLRLG